MNLPVCVSIFIFCMIWPSILLLILGLWEGPNQILFLAFGISWTLFFLVFFSQLWRCVDFKEKREELGEGRVYVFLLFWGERFDLRAYLRGHEELLSSFKGDILLQEIRESHI